jgi:hypothetical protein
MTESKFYSSYHYGDNLNPGKEIKINHSIYLPDKADILSDFIGVPLDKLQASRDNSAAKEAAIFESICEAADKWEAQAANTARLEKAIEYAELPQARHTSNKWVKDEYGSSISNKVYQMNYRIYEDKRYNHETQKSEPFAWDLHWSVYTNSPINQLYNSYNTNIKIGGQDRKRFTDKAAMEKYLQGRIKAYGNLFTEISPPVPQEYAKAFQFHGCLMPGYEIAGQPKNSEREDKGAASVSDKPPSIKETISRMQKEARQSEKKSPEQKPKSKDRGQEL